MGSSGTSWNEKGSQEQAGDPRYPRYTLLYVAVFCETQQALLCLPVAPDLGTTIHQEPSRYRYSGETMNSQM